MIRFLERAEIFPTKTFSIVCKLQMSAFFMSLWFSIKFSCSNSITSQPQNYFMTDNQYTSQTVIANWCIIKRKRLLKRKIYNFAPLINFSTLPFYFPRQKYMLIKTAEKWSLIKNDKFIYLLRNFGGEIWKGRDEFVS